MLFFTIAIIELCCIIILVCIILEYEKVRRKLKQEITQLYQDIGLRMSGLIMQITKHAEMLRHTIPKDLYTKSCKKNAIVKETCITFYERLIKKL